jgi:hypothetical protein
VIPVGIYAANIVIVKIKNIFQQTVEEGGDITALDEYKDFAYTPITTSASDERDSAVYDVKTAIYKMMLDSIDNYNTIRVVFIVSDYSSKKTIELQTDIDKSLAYQAIYNGDVLLWEDICNGDTILKINHENMSYSADTLQGEIRTRADALVIPLEERITTMDDGLPCFNYRANVTNCPLASYCIFPQEIAFSYLKNQDLWDITGKEEYLGCECTVISGTTTSYTEQKQGGDHFIMYIDCLTGVLLKLINTKDGEITSYITVSECSYDNINVRQDSVTDISTYKN